MHWIGSGSKQHKKRRGKSVVLMPSNATGGPRWLPRAERFVRHALLAELAFVDLHRVGFFFPSLGNSEEMANSTFPYSIGTFFTQTHSPESRAPGRRQCEEAFGRPLGHFPLDVHRGAFFRFPLQRWVTEDKQKFRSSIEAPVPRSGLRKSRAEERRCPPSSQLVFRDGSDLIPKQDFAKKK